MEKCGGLFAYSKCYIMFVEILDFKIMHHMFESCLNLSGRLFRLQSFNHLSVAVLVMKGGLPLNMGVPFGKGWGREELLSPI